MKRNQLWDLTMSAVVHYLIHELRNYKHFGITDLKVKKDGTNLNKLYK